MTNTTANNLIANFTAGVTSVTERLSRREWVRTASRLLHGGAQQSTRMSNAAGRFGGEGEGGRKGRQSFKLTR